MAWHNESNRHSMARKGIKTVQKINPVILNIDKYQGKWYEIARLPTWFQQDCKCAIAEYTKKKGYIQVKNSCVRDNERDFEYAKAYRTENSKDQLDVYFNPFIKGEYKVLYIDKTYNTAIVGTPDKKYLWFLSRTKNIHETKINKLKMIAKQKGYTALSNMRIEKGKCNK